MRVSPLSLPAQSVFRYDLQEDLLNDLAKLRKMACDDGDVVFVLHGHDSVWVHSPLFYVASGNKLPTEFGNVIGKAINDRGKEVTIISVPEKNRPFVERFLQRSYTIESLELLWKAMGSDDVRLKNKDERMEASTRSMKSTLPESMLPDFEISLGDLDGEETNGWPRFSIKVHRFLLDIRVEYYQIKTRAGLRFKDPTPHCSKLSRAIFTDFSLWSIAMHVYCGIPSAIFGIDANLQDYITEPEVDKESRCSEFYKKGLLPAEGVENLFLQISIAANFFLVTQLEDWAHFQTYRLAHQFQCTGNGCAEIIPYILQAVYDSDVTDEWMFNKGISWFSQLRNIPSLWKRSLISKSSVLPLLIERIKSSTVRDEDEDEDREEENRFIRGEEALELFIRLWKLRQYTSLTKSADKWDNNLINPLMGHATEVILEDLSNSIAFTINRLKDLRMSKGFSKFASEDLIRKILDNASSMEIEGHYWSNIEILKELIKKKEVPRKEPRLEEKMDSQSELHPEHDKENGGLEKSGTKVESRLKASASPFVPREIPGLLVNQEDVPKEPIYPEIPCPDDNNASQDESSVGDQNSVVSELKEHLPRPASGPLAEMTILQSKRQNYRGRRHMSTPLPKGESQEEQGGNENRRFTGPSIGGAIPFCQQMKMTNR
ncbi:uncharacterized protein H6S33_008489 [Morchella sextelata]|jgi:hypothetical protein|uniref:uncharacterized protein n=1 Tax=Morchella sextelata TaxID=1174677 RepID=UPI001D0508AD|nr:uncharacterized protein H6S33_008489 [Morchella sextelata]KAH0602839.1 hypothetical protein H6S33_008489 [Morchella sextelata]